MFLKLCQTHHMVYYHFRHQQLLAKSHDLQLLQCRCCAAGSISSNIEWRYHGQSVYNLTNKRYTGYIMCQRHPLLLSAKGLTACLTCVPAARATPYRVSLTASASCASHTCQLHQHQTHKIIYKHHNIVISVGYNGWVAWRWYHLAGMSSLFPLSNLLDRILFIQISYPLRSTVQTRYKYFF